MLLSGVPKGVINLVFGYGKTAGQAIVEHPGIPLISFTGGTATAEHIRRSGAHLCKKFSLEVGPIVCIRINLMLGNYFFRILIVFVSVLQFTYFYLRV